MMKKLVLLFSLCFVFSGVSAFLPQSLEAAPGGPAKINWLDTGYGSKTHDGKQLEKTQAETKKAQEEAAKNAEKPPPDVTPMAPPLVFAIINFLLLIALLVWKGGPPIRKYVKGRHDDIKSALEESAKLRSEAKAKLAEYSERISGVESEVEALLKETRDAAESEKKRILADAEAQVEAMKKAAEERISADIARARHILEEEIANAAIAAAEKILLSKTTKQDQGNLVDSFIAKIGEGA